jgi:phage shock protein E
MYKTINIIIMGLLGSLLGWTGASAQTPSLSPAQLKAHHAQHGGIFVDVRTPQEYAGGHVKGCLHIDALSRDFDKAIAKLDKEKTYYVYCASGGRSENAVDRMIAMGFKSAYNVGGFSSIRSDFPVETGK